MILLVNEFGDTWTQTSLAEEDKVAIDEGVIEAFHWTGGYQQWINGEWKPVRNREKKGEEE